MLCSTCLRHRSTARTESLVALDYSGCVSRFACLGCLFLIVGCDALPSNSLAQSTASASAALPTTPLAFVVNGETKSPKSVLAFSEGGHAVQLVVSTLQMSCRDVLAKNQPHKEGELTVTASVAPAFDEHGVERWRVRRMEIPGASSDKNLGPAMLVDRTDRQIKLRLDAKHYARPDGKPMKIELRGEATADNCGLTPAARRLKPQPIDLELQGKSYKVTSAIVKPSAENDYELIASTGAGDCDNTPGGNGSDLWLRCEVKGGAVARVQVDGDVLGVTLLDDSLPLWKIVPKGPLIGDGVVEIDISANRNLFGYKLRVKGTVTALRCSP